MIRHTHRRKIKNILCKTIIIDQVYADIVNFINLDSNNTYAKYFIKSRSDKYNNFNSKLAWFDIYSDYNAYLKYALIKT